MICWLTSSSMHLLLMYGSDWPWHSPTAGRLYPHLVCMSLPFIVSLYDIGCLWYWPCIDVMHDSSPWPGHPSLLGPLGSCKKFMLLSPMFHNHRASLIHRAPDSSLLWLAGAESQPLVLPLRWGIRQRSLDEVSCSPYLSRSKNNGWQKTALWGN